MRQRVMGRGGRGRRGLGHTGSKRGNYYYYKRCKVESSSSFVAERKGVKRWRKKSASRTFLGKFFGRKERE